MNFEKFRFLYNSYSKPFAVTFAVIISDATTLLREVYKIEWWGWHVTPIQHPWPDLTYIRRFSNSHNPSLIETWQKKGVGRWGWLVTSPMSILISFLIRLFTMLACDHYRSICLIRLSVSLLDYRSICLWSLIFAPFFVFLPMVHLNHPMFHLSIMCARFELGKSVKILWEKFISENTIFNLKIKGKPAKNHRNCGFRTFA